MALLLIMTWMPDKMNPPHKKAPSETGWCSFYLDLKATLEEAEFASAVFVVVAKFKT